MKNVTIYTTSACIYCKMTKEFFTEHNIEYTEKNVATDQAAAQEMIDKSGQMGVPVTLISGDGKDEVIVGFDEERLTVSLVATA
ncbi:MAG: glutaredoxin family protein [bacterium]|nr:glutaredoxin family protein [bacterium]